MPEAWMQAQRGRSAGGNAEAWFWVCSLFEVDELDIDGVVPCRPETGLFCALSNTNAEQEEIRENKGRKASENFQKF
jgi:hypothetical protein